MSSLKVDVAFGLFSCSDYIKIDINEIRNVANKFFHIDQVADFGLAKLSSETITHVSTRIMGTFGYVLRI